MEWPWQYSFPPFFSLQPHQATRAKQIEAWRHLVLHYCQVNTVSALDLASAPELPLFHNSSISRRLPVDAIKELLDDLAGRGNLEWVDKTKRRGLVYWRSPQQIGQEIFKWVSDSGQTGAVLTIQEIIEEGENNSWKGVGEEIVIKALEALECDKRCEVFEDNDGVKFF